MKPLNEISIEITHDCALKCLFCSSRAEHPPSIKELSFDTISKILLDSKKLGANIFSISGGEALLHTEIMKIIQFAHKIGYYITLYTSGTIFSSENNRIPINKDTFKKLREITDNNISIIFDFQSPDRNITNHLMNIEEAYDNLNNSINNALLQKINCEFHFVPMKLNYTSLPEIMEYADKIGIKKVNVLRFVPQGRGKDNEEELLCSPQDNFELQNIFETILKKKYKTTKLRLGHPIDFLFLVNPNYKIKSCRGGNDAPLIIPNGDVHMCPAWKELTHLKAGNIFKQSIIDIWEKSPFYFEFRKLITQNYRNINGYCKKCKYLVDCKGKCTAQRIISSSNTISFPKCLYHSPDPGCPLLLQKSRGDENE